MKFGLLPGSRRERTASKLLSIGQKALRVHAERIEALFTSENMMFLLKPVMAPILISIVD
ncbi:hypothetical protein HK19_15955 [Acetobacter persici]|nr:hypothetical protein HK19_15955 [Acetobacter persici]